MYIYIYIHIHTHIACSCVRGRAKASSRLQVRHGRAGAPRPSFDSTQLAMVQKIGGNQMGVAYMRVAD